MFYALELPYVLCFRLRITLCFMIWCYPMFYALDLSSICFMLYSYHMCYALDLELPYVLCFRVTLCFML